MYASMLKSVETDKDWTKRSTRSGRSSAYVKLLAVALSWSVKEVRPGSAVGSSRREESCARGGKGHRGGVSISCFLFPCYYLPCSGGLVEPWTHRLAGCLSAHSSHQVQDTPSHRPLPCIPPPSQQTQDYTHSLQLHPLQGR